MEKFIEINLTKATVFLTEGELRKLLYSDIGLYQTALKRGKAFKRARQRQQREEKKREIDDSRWDWDGL